MALFDLPLDQLRTYLPELDEAEDLDDFWRGTLAEARRHPVHLASTIDDTGLSLVRTWDVTFAGFDGHPVRAWFSVPAGTTEPADPGAEGRPVVVEYLGYGRGRGLPHERLTWVAAGYAHLLMDTRGQGGQYGNGGDTDDPVGSGPSAPGFLTRGIGSPRTYYYTRLITDAVRAVDLARTLPGTDPDRVVVLGNSQGGGMALAVSGLVAGLAGVLPSVPFLCHTARALDLTDAAPWDEAIRYLSVQRDAVDTVRRTLSYVDGAILARRATAPTYFAVGLRDTVCPPSTVFAAFNHYGALHPDAGIDKRIEVYPFNHHEGGDAIHARKQLDWLAEHVPVGEPVHRSR